MTQDVDILSPRAEELAEELRAYLSHRFQIAVRTRTVAGGQGHRLYQVRNPKNRHLVNVRSVDALPAHQVVEGILVVPPAELISQKVQSMVNRSRSAKGPTDLTDIRRLLLTFPDLKATEGLVADCLRSARARAGHRGLARHRRAGDRSGERRRRILSGEYFASDLQLHVGRNAPILPIALRPDHALPASKPPSFAG